MYNLVMHPLIAKESRALFPGNFNISVLNIGIFHTVLKNINSMVLREEKLWSEQKVRITFVENPLNLSWAQSILQESVHIESIIPKYIKV